MSAGDCIFSLLRRGREPLADAAVGGVGGGARARRLGGLMRTFGVRLTLSPARIHAELLGRDVVDAGRRLGRAPPAGDDARRHDRVGAANAARRRVRAPGAATPRRDRRS